MEAGFLLRQLQAGIKLSLPQSRPMPEIAKQCHELRILDENKTWRIVYRIDPDAIVIAEIFAKKSKTTPTPPSKTSTMKKFDGYFNFFYDTEQDKIYLEIKKLDEEFLYVNSLTAGIGSNDIGLDRGQLGNTRVVKFTRVGPKVLMVHKLQLLVE